MSEEFNNHSIHTDWRLSSDHVPLTVKISIFKENIQTRKCIIIKNSKEDHNFVADAKNLIKGLNTFHINSKDNLENIVQEFANNMDEFWFKHSKLVNITKHLNSWCNKEYQISLKMYRNSRQLDDWKNFKRVVKTSKHEFFNSKIQEILNKRKGSWELMNWIRKSSAIKAIKYNNKPCLEIEDLWQTLYELFNSAQHCQIDKSPLDKIPNKP